MIKVSWKYYAKRKGGLGRIKAEVAYFRDDDSAKKFAQQLNYEELVGVPLIETVKEEIKTI